MRTEWKTANALDDRQKINRARQLAEDLFKPRQQIIRPDVPTGPDSAPSAEHQPRRQPRIFAIAPQRPINTAKVEVPAEPKPIRQRARREAREIPASQHGRARTLANYGMTREQVAELHGVTVDEIKRIMSRPGHARTS